MYSLTFQYFRAILCDRRSASDVTGRDNAYNYFNIKQNTMKKRVHEMELNRSSVQMVLAERFPGYSRASDFNSVISDPQDIMVRGNEESFMEHGFGVAGLNCLKLTDKSRQVRLLQREILQQMRISTVCIRAVREISE